MPRVLINASSLSVFDIEICKIVVGKEAERDIGTGINLYCC